MSWPRLSDLRRRSVWTLIAATALLSGLVGASAIALGAQRSGVNFTATASAAAYQLTLRSGALALATEHVAAMPAAQAQLGSSGQSLAYAAAPYPSETGTALPGLLNTTLGTSAVPPYPLIAFAQAGTNPDAEVSQGPVLLRAHADAAVSRGLAQVSAVPGGGEAVSTAVVTSGGDSAPVVATGDSVFEGLLLGGNLLEVGHVHSSAKASVAADGRVSVTSALDVTGLSIAGVGITADSDGLTVAQDTRIPTSLAELNALLEASDIALDYLEPRLDPDGRGITAAGLQITWVLSPPQGESVTVVQTLGRARARIDGVSLAPDEPSSAPWSSSTGGPGAIDTQEPTPSTVEAPSLAGSDKGGPTIKPISSAHTARSALAIAQFGLLSLYLAIVVAGIFVGGCGLLFRYLAVQRRWT